MKNISKDFLHNKVTDWKGFHMSKKTVKLPLKNLEGIKSVSSHSTMFHTASFPSKQLKMILN
jgi:hypothetical protein